MNEMDRQNRGMPPVSRGGGLNTVLLITLVLLSVITLLSLKNVTSSVEDGFASYESQLQMLSSQVASLQQTNQVLSDRLAGTSVTTSTIQTQQPETTVPTYTNDDTGGIEITRQPLSVETTLGRSDALLFSMKAEATNSAVTFTWQKLNESTNAWETIKFEYPGYNDDMGLRLYDNSVNGETQLWANGLTESAFGIYRCIVSDARNNQVIANTVSATVKVE